MVSLSVGTAQWGEPYGVTNQVGRLTDERVAEIVSTALSLGISDLDTAPSYGDAESRVASRAKEFHITTKVRGGDSSSIRDQLMASMGRLGVESIEACLVHDWSRLNPSDSQRVAAELEALRSDGIVRNVGISAYEAQEVERAQAAFCSLDRAQVPLSILDQRLASDLSVLRAWESGTRFIARSIFLQGLLASESESQLGKHPDVRNFHEICRSQGVSAMSVALDFVRTQPWVSQIVVGVTSSSELEHLGRLWAATPLPDFPSCSSNDIDLLDPRRWRS